MAVVAVRPSVASTLALPRARRAAAKQQAPDSALSLRGLSGRIRTPVRMAAASEAATAPALPVHLEQGDLEEMAQDAVVWASQHGLVVGASDAAPAAIVHAPISLLPAPFPKPQFQRASAVATDLNLMIDAVARDQEYLKTTLEAAGQDDEFTGRLLKLNAELSAPKEDRILAINRSDYMLDEPTGRMLQVELNTIASSFGCLSNLVGNLHKYITGRLPAAWEAGELPENSAMRKLPEALALAVERYGGGVVLMVVQPGERNAYDQQWLQTVLWETHGVRTIRRSLAEVAAQGKLDGNGQLCIGKDTVAVSYLRAGYTPNDYPSEIEWDGRKLLETSDAFKCPSVAYQLAGTKKVQQHLAGPGVLEKYTPDQADEIRAHFAGLWSLDDLEDTETAKVVADAISNPRAYVLKPQREGGGNNLYDDELVAKLQAGESLRAFILMQRILPPTNRSVFVRNGIWTEGNSLQELGIYGTFIRIGDEVVLNESAGHLVRTKMDTSNEGGVAAGFAVLDSPYLQE